VERDRRERRRKAEELFVAGANMGVVVGNKWLGV